LHHVVATWPPRANSRQPASLAQVGLYRHKVSTLKHTAFASSFNGCILRLAAMRSIHSFWLVAHCSCSVSREQRYYLRRKPRLRPLLQRVGCEIYVWPHKVGKGQPSCHIPLECTPAPPTLCSQCKVSQHVCSSQSAICSQPYVYHIKRRVPSSRKYHFFNGELLLKRWLQNEEK
jgi:hypothetical protein